ncbi:hypothetical protein SASPL_151682 [Salvia splendens]|uniref:Uncharacterized protein n=1 Tax=Salvia splendens TaxID=180675 RepID=A0A8X8W8W2_SALSN|nr:hypothetical protein SASPL_151682 [Salvia splendens]
MTLRYQVEVTITSAKDLKNVNPCDDTLNPYGKVDVSVSLRELGYHALDPYYALPCGVAPPRDSYPYVDPPSGYLAYGGATPSYGQSSYYGEEEKVVSLGGWARDWLWVWLHWRSILLMTWRMMLVTMIRIASRVYSFSVFVKQETFSFVFLI